MPDDQWYTNKDLFELIGELQKDMQETRLTIKKYNGLYSKVAEVKTTVDDMQAQQKGKNSIREGIRNWGGWIFSAITLLVLLFINFM